MKRTTASTFLPKLLATLWSGPWVELAAEALKYGRKLFRGFSHEGMYEVLDYALTLELLDTKGKRATLTKRERVRYLQDHIIAFQDQTWGEGDILKDYRCSPGVMVDQYHLGAKTQVLISLRESKQRGDIDDFLIERTIHNGFLQPDEYLEIAIDHRMKRVSAEIILPAKRPPTKLSLTQRTKRTTTILSSTHIQSLPDGRWLIRWKKKRPRLYEIYLLRWRW